MKLESEYQPAFTAWKEAPSPKTMGALLTAVNPAINRAISAHVGDPNPILTGHARLMAADALKRYDPTQTGLNTFLVHQLHGLKRVSRKSQNIIPVPERVALQRSHLAQATIELSDKLGRQPSTAELADHLGLSTRRIEHIRKFHNPVPEGLFDNMTTADGEHGYSPAVKSVANPNVLELVYGDLSPQDQQIMEWSLGLHGQRRRQNQQIATALRLTPGAISQRKAAIQAKLDEMAELMPF